MKSFLLAILLSLAAFGAFAKEPPVTGKILGVWSYADGSGIMRIDFHEKQYGITMADDSYVENTQLAQISGKSVTFTYTRYGQIGQITFVLLRDDRLQFFFPDGTSTVLSKVRDITPLDRDHIICRVYPRAEVEYMIDHEGLRC